MLIISRLLSVKKMIFFDLFLEVLENLAKNSKMNEEKFF
jgi:hypothetical protein